jgi:Zn-dependent protease with chaperone function
MDAMAAAREMLPWASWGNVVLYPLLAFLLSWISAGIGALIASLPLRKVTAASVWTERARRAYPVRVVVRFMGVFAPIFCGVMAFFLSGPFGRVPAVVLAVLNGIAAYAAVLLVRRRVAWRIGMAKWTLLGRLRASLTNGLVLKPHLVLAFLLFAALPEQFDGRAVVLLVAGVFVFAFFAWGGGLLLARAIGLARPASERLRKIVETAATRTGIRPRGCYEVSSVWVNAWAFPFNKRLAFTESILATLDDEELTAVCAHELGHLTEPLPLALCRVVPIFLLLPLATGRLFFAGEGPHELALLIFLGIPVAALGMAVLIRRLSRRLEQRADRIGGEHEGDAGTYGRALEKIHAANLIPAVLAGRGTTHPHLYDRLIAAGTPPAYERPRPPSRWLPIAALSVALFLTGTLFVALPIALPSLGRKHEWAALAALALHGGATELNNLAYLNYGQNNKASAATLYRAAGAADRQSVYAPANLAIVLASLGRCEEAEEAAAEAKVRSRRNGSHTEDVRLAAQARFAVSRCWIFSRNGGETNSRGKDRFNNPE